MSDAIMKKDATLYKKYVYHDEMECIKMVMQNKKM